MTSLAPRAGRSCHAALNPLHSQLYFSPELLAELRPYGFTEWLPAYFAARAAPLGAVGAGTVAATFYNFSPALVDRHVPAVWELASPGQVTGARLRAADALLRRQFGEDIADSPEMAEAAALAERAAEACSGHGRPLCAANARLPLPGAPHLRLWHAATVLREHRGDGHLAVLLREGLDPVEALVSHGASGHGMTRDHALETRGWTAEDWAGAQRRLRARGLLDTDGRLTEDGLALRKEIENETDRLDRAPYEHLGPAGVQRLTELAGGWAMTVLRSGIFPAGIVAGR
ncbi:SCO6745 family protein [Streptomyces sp. YIM 98790]|uniref:SCO6745 family protein n=1 Tax=Streptomyces sp. YIM 98790 TaxID=2689077 RepID=UPI00140C160F|nr:hypothetical protein [Streptomyces sp. YIM 98790]